MEISIIVIGDELLIGQVTDTNSGFIARHIATAGWSVRDVHVVADRREDILEAVDRAFSRSRVVITTGGLGPTKDDITKEALRSYFGGEMQLNRQVLENVSRIMHARGLEVNQLTAAQAMVPTSCHVIQNRVGTAPIMLFEDLVREKILVAMPGVPFETREMFASEVFPELQRRFPSGEAIEHRTVIVEGISESDLAETLAPWESALPAHMHLAYLPVPGYIRLRLDGRSHDAASLRNHIDHYTDELIGRCGNHFLYLGDRTPEEILLEKLIAHGLTVSTAESCTGGNIARRLTSVPGSSAAVSGAVVAYSNEVKHRLLDVSTSDLGEYGAVSIPVVRQMALGASKVLGADVAIATSGIAGPGGGTPQKPVGTVCIAVSTAKGVVSHCFHFPGDRARVVDRASTTALLMAIRAVDAL